MELIMNVLLSIYKLCFSIDCPLKQEIKFTWKANYFYDWDFGSYMYNVIRANA